MSDSITIARPYAKALFEHALSTKKLEAWSEYLNRMAISVMDSRASAFLDNPATTSEQHTDLLSAVIGEGKSSELTYLKNFIATLAQNRRLMVLPQIVVLFEALKAEQEKTQVVEVRTFSTLSSEQENKLISSLSKRLQRQVTLNIQVDKTLLGGAVIHAGDLVIDGSVRGKLNKLATGLAA
jgi:F-type H+-transporting ATPase subunit delta